MSKDFSQKWIDINQSAKDADERSLFVEKGSKPVTQRQVIFYNEFLFIEDVLKKHGGIKKVLELGSGRGTIGLYLAKYLNLDISLLDDSPDAIAIAKKIFSEHGITPETYVGDALKTGIPDESFDCIVSIGLAEHFKENDLRRLFEEQYRLLKKGGVMISLNIPKKFSVQYLNTMYRFVRKLFGGLKEDVKKDYFRNTLKAKEYEKIARGIGFRDTFVFHECPLPIFTPLSLEMDKKITRLYNMKLYFRKFFMKNPFKTNSFFAQEHFLVGYK